MQMVLFRKAVIGLVCVTFFVSGCATTGENTTGRATGTAVGALGGALLGYKQGGVRGALLGGVLGGAAGYAVGWLVDGYTAKRTKSAQQVRDQDAQARPRQVQRKPEIHSFAVAVNPEETIHRGQGGEIVSSFDLVAGESAAVKVEEERSIISPDGKELMKKRYAYREVDGSGGYEFRSKFPVPKEVEQGKYTIASKLYVNDKETGTAGSGFQLVSRNDARRIARR